MGLLENKVAVVSGIGPGMGRDISLAFAREGADVVMCARRAEKLDEVAAEVEALGRRAMKVQADISVVADCDRVAAAAVDAFGRLDVLVNNAFHEGNYSSLMDSNLADWRATMDVNFFGTLQLIKACVPALAATGDGRIINVNTQSTMWIKPNYGAYAGSKGALATVTKTLARELGGQGIRVNAIHPGFIWGPSVEGFLQRTADARGVPFQEVYEEVAGETCLKYLPGSDEISGSVVFLASPLAKPVTGQAFAVNCGHYLP